MTVSQKSEIKRLNSFGRVFEQQYVKDNVIYGLRTLFSVNPLYMKLLMEIYDLDWKYNAETYKKQRKIWSELFLDPNVNNEYLNYHLSAMDEVRDDDGQNRVVNNNVDEKYIETISKQFVKMFPLDKDTNKNRKPYEYKTEEDDGYSYMAAEPVPERDDWIDMKLSATKPHIDEVCLVYGYQLPGMNKYFTAIYKGRGQWQPVMDNKYPLDFTILKWKHINLVNDEDEE